MLLNNKHYYNLSSEERKDLWKHYKKAYPNMGYSDMVNHFHGEVEKYRLGGKYVTERDATATRFREDKPIYRSESKRDPEPLFNGNKYVLQHMEPFSTIKDGVNLIDALYKGDRAEANKTVLSSIIPFINHSDFELSPEVKQAVNRSEKENIDIIKKRNKNYQFGGRSHYFNSDVKKYKDGGEDNETIIKSEKLPATTDPNTGELIGSKTLPEFTVVNDKNTNRTYSYLTKEYNQRKKELNTDPSKYNVQDYIKYGISEPGTQAEGLKDPLNWPAAYLAGKGVTGILGEIGEIASPYTSKIIGALNTPAQIGSKTIPWLTGENLMSSYFASKVPQDIKEGNYFDAVSNSLPFTSPILKGTYNVVKEIPNLTKSGLKIANNAIISAALAKKLKYNKPNFITEVPEITKIDPINRSSVNIKNDLFQHFGETDYNELLKEIYLKNQEAYQLPLVEFKGSKPRSYYDIISDSNKQEGLLFKEKFCPPGSECAKTSNAVTNKTFTDITGQPFDVQGNAHNAWHLEDQMTRHGGIDVSGEQLQVGDRILMGNGVNQSTYVPGYTADPNIRHAGMFAGIRMIDGTRVPVIFESGKNNSMFLNPLSSTFTGSNSAQKAFRPAQFIDNTFGIGLVDKNIRYAYRNKPSVANYSSNNSIVQKLLTDAENHREIIKRTHDITNDEFDELLNSLIGIGIQETKLNGALPSSFLPTAKIKLQNVLSDFGLTKPIKKTINVGKKIGNAITSSSSSLPKYPGTSFIEMESAKLAEVENISFSEALQKIKSQYQPKPKFTISTPESSKGMFRQKFQTNTDRVNAIGSDIKNKNSLENALGQMAQNYQKAKKLYPEASPRQLIDITTLMWNSPGKAANRNLVEFYMFGKNNPNPKKFMFDYVNKINKNKTKLINIKPNLVDFHSEFFRNGSYPEIQYQFGGKYQEGGLTDTEEPIVTDNNTTNKTQSKKKVVLTKEEQYKQNSERHDALITAKNKLLATETPENKPKMNMLYSTTMAAENEYGRNPAAYKRGYTNSQMSVDAPALKELFTPKGEKGRYVLQQKKNFQMMEDLGLPTTKKDLKTKLRDDDAYTALATTKVLYGNEKALNNLPNPIDTMGYINLYINKYNKKGGLKHLTREQLQNSILEKMRDETRYINNAKKKAAEAKKLTKKSTK